MAEIWHEMVVKPICQSTSFRDTLYIVSKAQTSTGNKFYLKKVGFLVVTLTDCIHDCHLNLHMKALWERGVASGLCSNIRDVWNKWVSRLEIQMLQYRHGISD